MINTYFDNTIEHRIPDCTQSLLRRIVKLIAEQEKPDLKLECTITFCDDEYIKTLNSQYRDVDSATDVLSFPLFDFDTPDRIAQLGDIVISLETAARQAREYGHSFKRELCFLTVHGMLHLFGYDHIEEEDRIIMEQRQREILEQMGVTR